MLRRSFAGSGKRGLFKLRSVKLTLGTDRLLRPGGGGGGFEGEGVIFLNELFLGG